MVELGLSAITEQVLKGRPGHMTIRSEEALEQEKEAADTLPPIPPDSGRRPRPRDRMATLPGEEEFECHDTIPAPPWFEAPKPGL